MRYRCLRCKLPPPMPPGRDAFEFEADLPICPRCNGGPGGVVELVDVHYLVAADDGPIQGNDGARYRVACTRKRDVLATFAEHYSASDVPSAVSCPSCKGTKEWQEQARASRELRFLLAAQEQIKRSKGG